MTTTNEQPRTLTVNLPTCTVVYEIVTVSDGVEVMRAKTWEAQP